MSSDPYISILVPARNEEENLERLFQKLEEQDYSDYEVVVVDGGSTDGTVDVAESRGARVLEGPQKGTAVARNLGWRNARGEVIYFLDADWFPGENALEEIARAFREENADSVDMNHRHYTDTWVSRAVSAENKFGHKSNRAKAIRKIWEKLRGVLRWD
ncbi:MAG: glycosyltransferase family 2 protein [Candidatus Nanohaloarchaea archaeon]